ncbi:hypothetical protein CYMTET_40482 [Cymbomonas tetramitiformis]|uniref:Uncharacterized protein n=1 Tax=Cymbomonas tetramitiformis TaxID=36881 RepID=A0AAE0F2X6_9CHLO|nr:hypothetical protein CYMTET_40482 [Cymbomonas tetramitiformis]
MIIYVKTQFAAAGLDLATFDDVDKPVVAVVNELAYDTLSECIEADSTAEVHFVATMIVPSCDHGRIDIYILLVGRILYLGRYHFMISQAI